MQASQPLRAMRPPYLRLQTTPPALMIKLNEITAWPLGVSGSEKIPQPRELNDVLSRQDGTH
jgi:hypothetical protein